MYKDNNKSAWLCNKIWHLQLGPPQLVFPAIYHQEPLLITWFIFNPSMDNHLPGKVCDEITYPFLNFKGATIEV